ncbi:tetratricopeptide repeat protein [Pseudomonas chlororaphis]|uniref:tetratricopeptide repeat protein n=1 Tax=Pseudomonas chlororaphis TaxID=587753 RepID=UPI001B30D3D3|nr:tetratricopeptide repeat protein [Pseudomonas chlororaphis]QTT87543.1 tetratricopeptide repeat protein [Pseudomonas chlororaphis]
MDGLTEFDSRGYLIGRANWERNLRNPARPEVATLIEQHIEAILNAACEHIDTNRANNTTPRRFLPYFLDLAVNIIVTMGKDFTPEARRIHGPEHPNTLAAMYNLALSLKAQGASAEARVMQEAVLDAHQRILGPEHPDTLIAMSQLASTLREQGALDVARPLQEAVLDAHRRIFGPEHPSTLVSMNNLAITLQKHGALAEAQTLQVDVLDVRYRTLGREHPDTLIAMLNLAVTLYEAGSPEALPLIQTSANGLLKMFGTEHPWTHSALSWWKIIRPVRE